MHFVINLVSTTKIPKIGHSQSYDKPLIKISRSQALFLFAVNNSYPERIFVCLSTILNVHQKISSVCQINKITFGVEIFYAFWK